MDFINNCVAVIVVIGVEEQVGKVMVEREG